MVCDEDLKANLKPVIHGANITNILYSDGRVRAIKLPNLSGSSTSLKLPLSKIDTDADSTISPIDHPYLNRSLLNAAGLDSNDWCLGPSFRSPLSSR